jgi:hypothetical protein
MGCPNCGKLGRRKRIRTRKVRSLCYQKIAWLKIDYGEYMAKCGCCKSFHSHPPNVDLKAKYDHQVRQAVIDRILHDKLNLSTVQASMQRDFLLKLSFGYIYSALEHAIRQFDGNEFRQRVLAEFRDFLCKLYSDCRYGLNAFIGSTEIIGRTSRKTQPLLCFTYPQIFLRRPQTKRAGEQNYPALQKILKKEAYYLRRRAIKQTDPKPIKAKVLGSGTAALDTWMLSINTRVPVAEDWCKKEKPMKAVTPSAPPLPGENKALSVTVWFPSTKTL